jgi:four helix bundle protein
MDNITKIKTKSEPFEFQNWDVYRKSVNLVGICKNAFDQNHSHGVKGLSDQLARASLSVPLNIAEGISRFGGREKMNFFRIAKGSTFECVACVDVMKTLNIIKQNQYDEIIAMYCEVGKMLSGLIRSVQERESKGSVPHA